MTKYKMGNLEGYYEADSESEAFLQLIHDVCGANTIEEYEEYCKEVGVNPEIEITEIEV